MRIASVGTALLPHRYAQTELADIPVAFATTQTSS